MSIFSKKLVYQFRFIHPTSANHAEPGEARFMIRVEADHGATVHEYTFASPECMEGFRTAMAEAIELGAKLVLSDVQLLPARQFSPARHERRQKAS